MFRGIFAAAAAAFVITAGAASAELAKWDQERVAKYGQELKVATNNLLLALDAVGIQNIAQANAMYQAKDTMEMLDRAADGLAEALKQGKGHDETLPRFKRIDTLRRDAEEDGRRADIPESVFERIFEVGGAMIKLYPYYIDQPARGEEKTE